MTISKTHQNIILVIFLSVFFAVFIGIMLIPLAAYAVDAPNYPQVVNNIGRILNRVIPVIIGIALIVFLWGIFKYFYGSAEDRKEAKIYMTYGLVALLVMVSVWGLVYWFNIIFSVDPGGRPGSGGTTSVEELIP